MNKQLSLSLRVLGRKNTKALVDLYMRLKEKGYSHQQIDDDLIDLIQDNFEEEIEEFCNKNMIYSNMKVVEYIVNDLKKL
ncbi:hypothetical protein [Viridibacillus arvi]|uniref:hypothetical protein n=1 Tax=Viridibacillus arvi TaxID=263475 RepID=UPI0034CFA402